MSASYQQSAIVDKATREKDPNNRYITRGPRIRLSPEQVRDQALAWSGLLSEKLGGPSVMPEQPDGVWNAPYSGMKWVKSDGDDQWRRSLYTYWRRSSPYPTMVTFDAGTRDVCLSRRIRTNTPMQALNTLPGNQGCACASERRACCLSRRLRAFDPSAGGPTCRVVASSLSAVRHTHNSRMRTRFTRSVLRCVNLLASRGARAYIPNTKKPVFPKEDRLCARQDLNPCDVRFRQKGPLPLRYGHMRSATCACA